MSENNGKSRKSETFQEILERRQAYGMYQTPNCPNNVFIGKIFAADDPAVGKFILLNSKANPFY